MVPILPGRGPFLAAEYGGLIVTRSILTAEKTMICVMRLPVAVALTIVSSVPAEAEESRHHITAG
jgi:hypothetical protein